ncbi:FadR/GntR family transcriptional regulator [Sphingomonas sp. CJ20]
MDSPEPNPALDHDHATVETTGAQPATKVSNLVEARLQIYSDLLEAKSHGHVRKSKLGERIARLILEDVGAGQWQTGRVLGTERELIARYDISRATFREAVRQVEQHGAATMRRGAGGGLIVNSPPRLAAVRAIVTYLELTRISFSEQHEVREQLEVMAARLATERLDDAAIAAFNAILADFPSEGSRAPESVAWNMRARLAVATASHNPALPLFIEALNGVLSDILRVLHVDRAAFLRDRNLSSNYKVELINAILARDDREAERLVLLDSRRRLRATLTQSLMAPSQFPIEPFDAIPNWADEVGLNQKLSVRTCTTIVQELERNDWREGHNLGNEAALQEHLGVSRAVLREAVRQLELHGIVRVKPGVSGGLIVGRVDSAYTEEVVVTYLRSTGIRMRDLWEVQSRLSVFAAETLCSIASDADCEALRQAFQELEQATPLDFLARSALLHREIADRTENRALSLFIKTLLRYGMVVFPPVSAASMPWLIRQHGALVAAIADHDVAAATGAMTRLFTQSRMWLDA